MTILVYTIARVRKIPFLILTCFVFVSTCLYAVQTRRNAVPLSPSKHNVLWKRDVILWRMNMRDMNAVGGVG